MKPSTDLILASSIIILILGVVIAIVFYNLGEMSRTSNSLKDITGNALGIINKSGAYQSKPNVTQINNILRQNKIINAKPNTKNKHVPVNLSKNDILVSFRIDDITFAKSQKPVLQNALILAHKYNITFDLAVIAQPFDEQADPDTYQIFVDNQDVFEVVAHGLTHVNILPANLSKNGTIKSEFGGVDPKIQEQHIKQMHDIFAKYHLQNYGDKIFLLPWSFGDNNTIRSANKYGYKLMTQNSLSYRSMIFNFSGEKILISEEWVEINMSSNLKETDKQKFMKNFYIFLSKKVNRIQIITHPINFLTIQNSDNIINEISRNNTYRSQIKFSMISDRLKEI